MGTLGILLLIAAPFSPLVLVILSVKYGPWKARPTTPLRNKLADWYFDHGWGTYGDAYVLANDDIKSRYKRMRKHKSL